MDNIKVNTDALNSAITSMKDFKEQLSSVVSKCETALKNEFNGIDNNFKKDLTDYIDKLQTVQKEVELFESENTAALKDRITRISEYSKTSYKKRNI